MSHEQNQQPKGKTRTCFNWANVYTCLVPCFCLLKLQNQSEKMFIIKSCKLQVQSGLSQWCSSLSEWFIYEFEDFWIFWTSEHILSFFKFDLKSLTEIDSNFLNFIHFQSFEKVYDSLILFIIVFVIWKWLSTISWIHFQILKTFHFIWNF